MLGVGVFEQFGQLQWVLADFLHWCKKKPIQRDVNHLLKKAAGLKEIDVFVHFSEAGQLQAGIGMIVAVLRVYLKLCLLRQKGNSSP